MLAPQVARREAAERGLETELRLTVPSDVRFVAEAVELVACHLEARFVNRHTIRFNLRVALTEALANAILYGNQEDASKGVRVRILFGPNTVEMEVRDEGTGFDRRSLPDPTLPANRTRPYGRGLFLIRRLVDEVRFNPEGNAICMTLRRA